MSAFMISCLWCVLQVTLLLGLGVAISLLTANRYPRLATVSAASVVLASLVVTLLTPVPIPRWHLPEASDSQLTSESAILPEASNEELEVADGAAFASIDLLALASQMIGSLNEQKYVPLSNSEMSWLVVFVASCVFVGSTLLLNAVYSTVKLVRTSIPLSDRQALEAFRDVADRIDGTANVRLRVAETVAGAAVIGWLRPTILLSSDWQAWGAVQLRSVLAHELAHVARRDFFWRVLAVMNKTVHIYHPLAHWLLRRLTYSQELAADQLAATVVGGPTTYTRVLSQLAIRQDDRFQLRGECLFLPTLSSHLIRRIKMLRAIECMEKSNRQRAIRVVVAGAVMLLGAISTALRGIVVADELPSDDSIVATPAESANSENNQQTPQFARVPLDMSVAGENDEGVFVVNVSELLKQPAIAPYVPALNTYVGQLWQACFPIDDVPTPSIDLRWLDMIGGQAVVGLTPKTEEQMGSLQLGTTYVVLRFRSDIKGWKSWLQKNVPNSRMVEIENKMYLELPEIPAFGPGQVFAVQVDSHSLMLSWSSELLEQNLPAYQLSQTTVNNDTNNASRHTGLACMNSSLTTSKTKLSMLSVGTERPENRILANSESWGWDIDWSDDFQQLGVRMRFGCAGAEAANEIVAVVRELAESADEEAKQMLAKLNEKETDNNSREREEQLQDALLTQQIIESLKVQTTDTRTKMKQVELRFQLKYSLTEMLEMMTSDLSLTAKAESHDSSKQR